MNSNLMVNVIILVNMDFILIKKIKIKKDANVIQINVFYVQMLIQQIIYVYHVMIHIILKKMIQLIFYHILIAIKNQKDII